MATSFQIKSQLSAQQLMLLESEMASKRKSVGVAYLLDIFLGTTGAHRFYLGSTGIAVLQLLLFIIGIITVAVAIGFVFLGVTGLIAFIDLFTIPGMIREADAKAEQEILGRITGGVGVEPALNA